MLRSSRVKSSGGCDCRSLRSRRDAPRSELSPSGDPPDSGHVRQVQERLAIPARRPDGAAARGTSWMARCSRNRLVERKYPLRIERIGIGGAARGVGASARSHHTRPSEKWPRSNQKVSATRKAVWPRRSRARDAPVKGGAEVLALTVQPRNVCAWSAPLGGPPPRSEVYEVLAAALMGHSLSGLLFRRSCAAREWSRASRSGSPHRPGSARADSADERLDGRDDIAASSTAHTVWIASSGASRHDGDAEQGALGLVQAA